MWTRSSQPSRSRAHARIRLSPAAGESGALDDDLFASDIDLQRRQRTGRRSGDVSPLQVVSTVVARAPDVGALGAILDRAIQVSAGRGQGRDLTGRVLHEQDRLSADRNDPSGIRSDVGGFEVEFE